MRAAARLRFPYFMLTLVACATAGPAPSASAVAPAGERVSLKLSRYPDGAPHDLAQDSGSVVLLDVWATWCEPCREALPVYSELAQQYAGRGLKVYAINVDEDAKQIPAYLRQVPIQLPILLDPSGQAADKVLKVIVMPTSLLLDRKGVVRYVHRGLPPDFAARHRAEIEQLLSER